MKVLKVILMVLGVLFLIQILVVSGFFIGINSLIHMDFPNFAKSNKDKIKQMQPIINYVENYKDENGQYPKTIDAKAVKIKPYLYFTYEPNKELNCYSVTLKSKKSEMIKKYQRCSVNANNAMQDSQSYVEYSE